MLTFGVSQGESRLVSGSEKMPKKLESLVLLANFSLHALVLHRSLVTERRKYRGVGTLEMNLGLGPHASFLSL